ncbi:MAG: NTP transferase domain-containing protein [Anaerolineales bacterium]|nr:NTP transferase domain-containing protein [Anaerolineales bacterium]
MENIPVVIFCGGQGTRMRGGTLTKKELVEVGGRPIIWHVMRIFSAYGFNQFVLPLGHEAQQIRRYFLQYEAMTRDFTVWLGNGRPEMEPRLVYHNEPDHPPWQVTLVETGVATEKASRVKMVAAHLSADRFFVTYGDGVGNVDLARLLAFHRAHGRLATVTAVQARYQYGVLEAGDDGQVTEYVQYPRLPHWINAGFMLFERALLEMIGDGPDVPLETDIFNRLVAAGQLMRFQHDGFWRSMDTLKDSIELENVWRQSAPWKVW